MRRWSLALALALLAGCRSAKDDWGVRYDHAALGSLALGTPREEVLELLGGAPRGEFELPGGGRAIAFGYGSKQLGDAEVPEASAILELDPEGGYAGLLYAWPEPAGAIWSPTDLNALIEQAGPLQPVPLGAPPTER